MRLLILVFFIMQCQTLCGQVDSTKNKKLNFTGDFRFRIEHDWNSRKESGEYRDDRSRLRYRFRFGLNYAIDKNSSFGGRMRSGNINDQQGPHITIGGNKGEFELVGIGLEKLFYQYKGKNFSGWVGKNSIPLMKLNEIFWNDNVFPEGVGLKYKYKLSNQKLINEITINAGHFIVNSKGKQFKDDSYCQIIQLSSNLFDERLKVFPGFYFFKNIGNYPDGKHTFELNYSIFHLGSQLMLNNKQDLKLGFEFYENLSDYSQIDQIIEKLKSQTSGFVVSLEYGKLKKKGDWLVNVTYANIQKYSIVDYFAQNDWSRWDYSSIGATGSRISNFHGIETKIVYAFKSNFNLNLRTYFVEQLIKIGDAKENGSRIRLDLNIGF